jgi:SOS-response transcriptional repressor LexA
MTTNEKLARLRASLGITQEEFGARLGISNQFISQVESGKRSVGLRFLKKVSETFGVSIAELVGEEDRFVVAEDEESFIMKLLKTMTPEEKDAILRSIYRIKRIPLREVPVLGYARAGEPLELVEITQPIDVITLPENAVKRVSYAVIVKGDSMKDYGIESGDYLLVEPDSPVESGDLVIALIDNKATFKKYKKEGEKICLEPANPEYEKIELIPEMDAKLLKVGMVLSRKGRKKK